MKSILVFTITALLALSPIFGSENDDSRWSGILSIQEVDTVPVPVKQDPPEIPATLRGANGVVHINFVIDENGLVPNARVVRSTDDRFDAIAVATVMNWQFQPAQNVGKAIPVRATVPIRFR